ncbi:hypothetical protein ACIRBX_04170 [Kitasatospora sp. NPDC096147]|uniref:hypothetical protein n=1 Tax=Kitasatospora sp. NPDC096147 TaxID=3364093 RepID=UPI0038187C39
MTNPPIWQPGDVVIDADGAVWTRTGPPDAGWSYPGGEPGRAVEPLTLLLRAGRVAARRPE